MNLTNQQLSALRSHPHKTQLWLSIYEPRTLMYARVTGTYSTGDTQITYYAAVSGTYLDLYNDLTVMIGTAPDNDDYGRLRMRSATGTYVVFAENGITWKNGAYLSFIDQIDVQAVYPRIIQDPNSSANVIFYKDGDIAYLNQNTVYGTFPNAGPHRATFLDSGTGTVYYTATGSYNVASSAMTYQWTFEGGTPTGSTALTPGNVRYHTPGHYRTRLRVTAANGGMDDTYRYVSVYDRPTNGTNVPILKWELKELSGSRSEGGYTASIKVHQNLESIQPNALVVIFSDTWYGNTKTSLGGNAQNASSIVFVGYILEGTIRFDWEKSEAEFQAGSVARIMKDAESFSVSCESKASPSTWFELQEMTVPKAIYHYLRWHSTVLKVTDFQYTGDDRLVQYFDADRGSLFDAVDSFMRDGMLGSMVSDRQGKLWAEIEPYGLQTPFSDIPERFTFHKQDWVGTPSIEERRAADLSFVELGGIIYYGVTSNTFKAVLTNAPSTTPLYSGKSDRNDGLILLSQQQLNQVAGNYLAHFNTRFPNVGLSVAGTYLNLDIAPLEQTHLVIDQNDTVRGRSIQDLPYIVDGMDWSYNPKNESFRPEVTLLQIATGTAGETVLIPAVPPDGGWRPNIEFPPPPQFTSGGQTINISRSIIIHDASNGEYPGKGILYTENFDASSPTWFTMNAGLTIEQARAVNKIVVTTNGAVYVAFEGEWNASSREGHFIARAPNVGGIFTVILTEADVEAEYPGSYDNRYNIIALGCRNDTAETVIYLAGGHTGVDTSNIGVYLGSGGSFSKTMTLGNVRVNNDIAYSTYGQSTWGVVYKTVVGLGSPPAFHRFNSGATAETFSTVLDGTDQFLIRAADSAILYQAYFYTKIKRSLDNGSTWVALPDTDDLLTGGIGLAVDDTGQFLMAQWDVGKRGRSSDYGTTWSGLPNLPVGAGFYYGYMGGTGATSQWVAIGRTTVRYSPDFGNTWLNREGNISSILGVGFMDMVVPIR